MKLKILIFILLNSIFSGLFAQEITGKVYELYKGKKRTLPGVNILWMGTSVGTSTNINGEFSIKRINETSKLVFSYVGYKSDTLTVDDNNTSVEMILSGLKEIEEVKVVEKNGAYFDQTKPLQTQKITKSELKKAACCNLAESFETNASVDVDFSDAVSGAKQIKLLGLAGKYTQIMIENIPGIRGLSTTYGLNYVPGPWMESIQISKGTASVVNGYESITGQINVEFKKPDQEEKFYIDWYQNSMYKTDVNSNLSFILSDEISTMLFAHAEYSYKGIDHNSDKFFDMPKIKQMNFLNRWKYRDKNGIVAQLGVSYLSEERIAGQDFFNEDLNRNQSNGYGINIKTNRFEVFSKTGYVFTEMEATTFGWINKLVYHDQDSYFGLKNYSGKQYSYYSNFIFSTILGSASNKINFGLSYVYDKYEEQLDDINLDRNEKVPGAFVEYTYAPDPTLVLMAGLRVDNHNDFGTFLTPRLHLKYNFDEKTIARISVGKGYRSSNIIAENTYLLANSRQFKINQSPEFEESWNYGISFTKFLELYGKVLSVTLDYHRTDFINKVVIDQDNNDDFILVDNLDGKAFSNNYQIEMSYSPVNQLDLLLAFRYTDAKTTIQGRLLENPLTSRYKSLFNLSYLSGLRLWQYDITFQYNGKGRIPERAVDLYGNEFDPYLLINFQITRYLKGYEIYFGGENITGYKQDNPIINSENPFSNNFDASTVWAPITGAKFYLGFRYSI